MRNTLHRTRGVSLIEALVALAIMAIGMLGIVGVQATLRSTSDLAKQRSEAVRIAQQQIERWRAFITIGGGPNTNYDDLPALGAPEFVSTTPGINANYTLSRTVTQLPAPRLGKSIGVTVTWDDRSGQQQRVDLSSLIAGISPELSHTLIVPGGGDLIQQPVGRKRGIPVNAKDLGGGRSGWIPPGSPSGVAWIFNNITGVITVCAITNPAVTTSAGLIYDLVNPGSNNVDCSAGVTAVYVQGYLRYALGTAQPAPADAVNPPSQPLDAPAIDQVSVNAHYAVAGTTQIQACYVRHVNAPIATLSSYSEFNCAVPANPIPVSWTGRLWFGPVPLISTSAADTSNALLRVCRYHAAAAYSIQTEPLTNQNFLLIRSGDGAATNPVAYTCPTPLYAHAPP